MKRKCLAVGIILLFVAIAFSPTINARNGTQLFKPISPSEANISFIVLEYKPDGTVEKSVVKMSQQQADKFNSELIGVKDLDTRLSIYKKYNLIPQDVTAEKLRLGMEEKAQRIGVTQEKLKQLAYSDSMRFHKQGTMDENKFLYINIKCNVLLFFVLIPLIIPFGQSFLTIYLPNHHGENSKDLWDICISPMANLETTNGIFPDFDCQLALSLTKLIGFVGYFVWYVPPYGPPYLACSGYTSYIRAIGMPMQ